MTMSSPSSPREQVTDVLFLYNANTYFEDTSLADVLNVSEN